MLQVSQLQAQKFLIKHSLLHQLQPNLLDVVRHLSCLQVDPISVVAPNHELILFNRVDNFKSADLYNALYQDRQLFEYWLQLYSIIPIEDFPYFGGRRQAEAKWQQNYFTEHKLQIEQTLDYIRQNGPTSSKELAHIPPVRNLFSWSGSKSNTGLLNYLWDRGEVLVSHRQGNRKYYDLKERILPTQVNFDCDYVTTREFLLRQQFRYTGLVRSAFLSRMGYVKSFNLKELLLEKLATAEILAVKIADTKSTYYIWHEDKQALLDTQLDLGILPLRILPPLDPLIIDRQLIKDVFNFDYTWEAYVPATKRKFGYYGMPVLYQGELIGQIELIKTTTKKLKIKRQALHTKQTPEFKAALPGEINRLAKFVFN
jgi:uncharacterized protein YcaQ